ncbi:MAG: SCO family protein [Gammaproteobacteria bacterium]|nr:SCO family protein [Gammaproteobacteria bacterium]
MRKSRIVAVAVLALATGFTIALIVKQLQPVKLESATWFGDHSRALPEFELIDQNNNKLKRSDFEGRWHLIFFGYTHCPDICPASLQTLADMVKLIDDRDVANLLEVAFISVDPARDRPEILKSYVEYFNPDFIAATASPENLDRITGSLGIAYFIDKNDPEQQSYEVGHSSGFVLINPAVELSGLFSAPHDSRKIANDLIKIIERY